MSLENVIYPGRFFDKELEMPHKLKKNIDDEIPPGFTLRHTLRGHAEEINQIAWSPDGQILASQSSDRSIVLWDAETGRSFRRLERRSNEIVAWSPHGQILALGSTFNLFLWNIKTDEIRQILTNYPDIHCLTWSLDGQTIASDFKDKTIRLWNAETGKLLQKLAGHTDTIRSVAWSPDGYTLASGANDQNILLWNTVTGNLQRTLRGHSNAVTCVAWSPDGSLLASSSLDNAILLWNPQTGQGTIVLEGHTNAISSLSFSFDGRFLASKSRDGTIRLWYLNSYETVAILDEASSYGWYGRISKFSYGGKRWNTSLDFHPQKPILATLGKLETDVNIWELDMAAILETAPATHSVHYTNAKVVLVGDSGVGKSGLGLVLSGQPFAPTESTHGRNVWPFHNQEVELSRNVRETRETWLWDLAGQPGYRLIHQLHLNEVALALLVFDSHSETDPFAGIHHWVRALRIAERVQGASTPPIKKILVAARIDRGGAGVSRERIEALAQEWGFDSYFETSAKEGLNIAALEEAVKGAIDWEKLPKVTSTKLFQRIKAFLVAEKEAGHLLSTRDDLYRAFLKSEKDRDEAENLYAQFETCTGRVESQGLIRRLSFGNLVLLQAELLDAYASALVNAIRDEPDGLGSILEEKVRACGFPMPKGERIQDKEQEKLLLIAMIEDLLRYEIALREQGDDGAYLVFPSQSTRENPDLPNPEGKAVVFRFEGPVFNIYATLAVRLAHSSLFTKKELWKDAVTYTTKMGGIYGMFLRNIGEGRGELTLFFDKAARAELSFHFGEFVYVHLQRRALPESLKRNRIFACSVCGAAVTEQIVELRQGRGFNWLDCPVCGERISLLDREERLVTVPSSQVLAMDRAADSQRDREAAKSTIQGKIATKDFDVFLCYNSKDKVEVKQIGEQLKEQGILPWLDEWELPPGMPWQRYLEKQMKLIKAAAVFVGKGGIGPWQQMEVEALLRKFVKGRSPVIPVILATAPKDKKPRLPVFLEGLGWVDFRTHNPDPMKSLLWGIRGKREDF